MRRLILGLLICCFVISLQAQTPISIDSAKVTRHGPDNGSLVIIGGGKVITEIWNKMIALAGGPEKAQFVVVTNASGDGQDFHSAVIDSLSRRLGANKVTSLHLNNIKEANEEKNIAILKKATGIYFSGGRQWRIADVYLNTLAHQEFFNLLNRGGVIAGSSAGASIQGSFLWRGDTGGPQVLIGDHTQGLGFLKNSAIDQHILVRNRQFDLQSFIKIAPQLIGVGLDESTAIVVKKDEFEVIGKSYVTVHDANTENFVFLKNGQKYNLKAHEIIRLARRENR